MLDYSLSHQLRWKKNLGQSHTSTLRCARSSCSAVHPFLAVRSVPLHLAASVPSDTPRALVHDKECTASPACRLLDVVTLDCTSPHPTSHGDCLAAVRKVIRDGLQYYTQLLQYSRIHLMVSAQPILLLSAHASRF